MCRSGGWVWHAQLHVLSSINRPVNGSVNYSLIILSFLFLLFPPGLEAEFGTHNAIRGLSGGQKVKLVLAAAMWNNPHLLVS